MKRKIAYLGIAALLTLTTSCAKYLEVDSPSKFEPNYVFNTEADIFTAISGLYDRLTTDQLYSHYMITSYRQNNDVEFRSGSATINTNGDDYHMFEPMSSSGGNYGTWENLYKVIERANMCVAGIESYEGFQNADKTKPSTVTQYYGEAKTIRAWIYLDLVRLYGDVPFRITPAQWDFDFTSMGPTDRDTILTVLIDDLIACEPLMLYAADHPKGSGAEHANREFCQGLIARMALTRGGWALRPDKNNPAAVGYMARAEDWRDYYKLAETYAGKVITEGEHDLKYSFKQLWIEECNWNTQVGDDIIFDVPLLKGSSSEFAYSVGIRIAPDAAKHPYGNASGGNMALSGTYVISFDPKDLRRDMTCAMYAYNTDLNQVASNLRWNTSVTAAKWCKLYMREPMGGDSQKGTGVNNPIMRFADVLLMYAEATNENNNGPTEAGVEAFKRVRRRAFAAEDWPQMVDHYADSVGASKESFFDALFNERKWEFGGENMRRHDLARWNLYSRTVYRQYFDNLNIGLVSRGQSPVGPYRDWVEDYSWAPEAFYWKDVENPERPGTTMLDWRGIRPRLHVPPPGYTTAAFGTTFGSMVTSTDPVTGERLPEEFQLNDALKYGFQGFISPANQDLLDPNNLPPLRYLIPIPAKAIADHKGNLVNYYGFK